MFNVDDVYRVQPDAILRRLHSLDDWMRFSTEHDIASIPRRAAAVEFVRERGIRSLHAGEARPSVIDFPGGIHWDVVLNGLDNCNRAVLDLVAGSRFAANKPRTRIFAAEATSSLALALRGLYPRFLGSLYMPDAETRADHYPIPHQDLQALTLPSDAFDLVISIEVLEHVHDLALCLREQARVLKPGGVMLATFPFNWVTHETVQKARVENGSVQHLVDNPEYHGDPMRQDGILVFRSLGWDIVDLAKDSGFREAYFIYYSTVIGGIIGQDIMGRFIFAAEK